MFPQGKEVGRLWTLTIRDYKRTFRLTHRMEVFQRVFVRRSKKATSRREAVQSLKMDSAG